MKRLKVELPHHEYEILIDSGVLKDLSDLIEPFAKTRKFVAIVTDENLLDLYARDIQAQLQKQGWEVALISVKAGESSKSWPVLSQVADDLLAARVERDDLVIALGGGVVGDLVGFAASILRRGVRFIQVPTSLLAQVDSSVGGKTGINSAHGKNLIGAFYQPELVVIDTDVLTTLPEREFLAGYGEVAKYGLLGDSEFFDWLDEKHNQIKGLEPETIAQMIAHCCQIKADIVARDEKERGDRALLNLGHTFGHALEKVTGYSDRLLHGEGVAIGCGLAFDLSHNMGFCDANAGKKLRAHFEKMGMKAYIHEIEGAGIEAKDILEAMYQDKKVKSGQLTFILANEIGSAFIENSVDENAVLSVLKASC